MSSRRKVYLDFIGCRLNQAEIEQMGRQFAARGDEIVEEMAAADLVVINTCAVTSGASKGSRKLIRRAGRENPNVEIIATGCYAEIAPELVKRLPNVRLVVGNAEKDRLVRVVAGDRNQMVFELEPVQRDPLPPGTLGRTRAFVKAQDGCDNRCTFCVTTLARGAGRSRALAEIVGEIKMLVGMGYQEVVLTGVHLGSYGRDDDGDGGNGRAHWPAPTGRSEMRGRATLVVARTNGAGGLDELIKAVLRETDIRRLRLSSLEPWDLEPGFFNLWEDERLCGHLHMPLQSGCDATLRRMARRTTPASFADLVEAARVRIPNLGLTTDVIVGFPGETEEEFADSVRFIEAMDFAKLHVFPYSRRPGTAAAQMPGQVPAEAIEERKHHLLALSKRQWARFCNQHVGQRVEVLWESARGGTPEGYMWGGHAPNFLRVETVSRETLQNRVRTVDVVRVEDGVAVGKIGNE